MNQNDTHSHTQRKNHLKGSHHKTCKSLWFSNSFLSFFLLLLHNRSLWWYQQWSIQSWGYCQCAWSTDEKSWNDKDDGGNQEINFISWTGDNTTTCSSSTIHSSLPNAFEHTRFKSASFMAHIIQATQKMPVVHNCHNIKYIVAN